MPPTKPAPPRQSSPARESCPARELSPFPPKSAAIVMHNLRTTVQNKRRTYTTWLDQDESGDYAPKASHDFKRPKNQLEPTSFEPAYRRDCKACTQGRMVCSYRAGGDQRQPCSDCVRLKRQCELPTPRMGRDIAAAPEPEWECPMRSISPAAPPCTVETHSKQKVQKPGALVFSTRLAHPINFNFQPGEEDQIACHWCYDMVYGIRGLGVVHVLVFDAGDGRGYVELENGHTANGHLPSRMCIDCTSHRVSIMACKVHEMQEIPKMRGKEIDQRMQARYLETEEEDPAPFEWCSVCPNVAYYACGKSDSISDSNSEKSSPAEIDIDGCGCGLRLCTNCMVKLVGSYDGDLTSFLTDLFRNTQRGIDGIFGLRADVDFLHPDGELMRRVRHNVTQASLTEAEPAHPYADQVPDCMDWKYDTNASNSGCNSTTYATHFEQNDYV